jgi:hypothetical protein
LRCGLARLKDPLTGNRARLKMVVLNKSGKIFLLNVQKFLLVCTKISIEMSANFY